MPIPNSPFATGVHDTRRRALVSGPGMMRFRLTMSHGAVASLTAASP